jgi:hypothetical protein
MTTKISGYAADALIAGNTFKSGNTEVRNTSDSVAYDTFTMYLHGSPIARMTRNTLTQDRTLTIDLCGYDTVTTKSRLNALPQVSVCTKRGQSYLNGKKWDGKAIVIGSIGIGWR